MAINNILKSIILDVYDHDNKTPKTVKSIAADNDIRYIAAEIQSEGVRYDVSASSTVELIILRPDKVGVSVTGQPQEFTYQGESSFDPDTGETTPGETITYYGVYAELDQVALAKTGILLGQFKITNGEQVLHTEIFRVNNGRALDTETSDWAGEYQGYDLDELVQSVNEMETDVSELKENLLDLEQEGYPMASIQAAVNAWANEHEDEIVNGYVTPEMYGAKGDGTTDDTEAIQTALNSGKDVYFGKKIYCVSQTLVLHGSINMGSDTTIKAISTMASVFSATNIGDRLRFIGGVIDCNSNADSGITLSGVNGAYIQNLKILNAVESSIKITSGGHNWVIGCKLYNQLTMAKGIESNSPDLKIIDCEIYYTECGIEQTYGILFVANTHIWSGGALNQSTSSVGIRMSAQTNPRLMANSLYLDSFYVGVDFDTAVGVLKMSE